ncbi:MAG: hypothetical protein K8F91_01405, partial [Candidatus Obscuribacterales bacterium]|nr:hypothetical protein [Candidatus Obscuribacterales bacterium]
IKRQRLIYAGIAVVLIGATLAFVSFFAKWGDFGYWIRRIFFLPLPFCLVIALNEVCKKIAPKQPKLSRKVFGFFSFGNPSSIANLAALDIDTGNYTGAEKLLSKAVKSINRKKKPHDYIATYSYLAAIRANTGKLAEADRQIVRLLEMATNHYQIRTNDVNSTLLATTLIHASTVADLKDDARTALLLVSRALELLSAQKTPPVDLLITALATTGYLKNLTGLYADALPHLSKAKEIWTRLPDARESLAVFIETNIGIAHMGCGRIAESEKHIKEALDRARAPLGKKELPRVFHAKAILESVNSLMSEADTSYKEGIAACESQKPADSLQLVRILREYSDFLEGTG